MKERVSEDLIDFLICPKTNKKLRLKHDNKYLISEDDKYCYPIVDGIPVLIKEFAIEMDLSNE